MFSIRIGGTKRKQQGKISEKSVRIPFTAKFLPHDHVSRKTLPDHLGRRFPSAEERILSPRLKINTDKTELLVTGTNQQLAIVGSAEIKTSNAGRNLCVMLDNK